MEKVIEETFSYEIQHLKNFLLNRPILSIRKLEQEATIPSGTIRHFLKGRRSFPEKYLDQVEVVLFKYGYSNLRNE